MILLCISKKIAKKSCFRRVFASGFKKYTTESEWKLECGEGEEGREKVW